MSPARIAAKMSVSAVSSPIGGSGVHGESRSRGDVQSGDLEQRRVVEQRGHLVDVLTRQSRTILELGDHVLVGVRLHLEADHGLEAPLLDLALDQRALADALLVVELDLRVAADPEQARRLDRHPGEELLGVRGDHLGEADEDALRRARAGANPQPLRQLPRHLDAHEQRLARHRIHELEGPGRREVRDERERMRGIEAERGQHRRDLGIEDRRHLCLAARRSARPSRRGGSRAPRAADGSRRCNRLPARRASRRRSCATAAARRGARRRRGSSRPRTVSPAPSAS